MVQVNSDEAGAGFAEVGALSEAKDALREAVQLPLQHPRLFQKGSLARWALLQDMTSPIACCQLPKAAAPSVRLLPCISFPNCPSLLQELCHMLMLLA